MVSFPPCKINLGLRVIRKRLDGYHDIETCFFPVPWTDILEIVVSHKFEFECTGLNIPGTVEDNLCVKAFRLLERDFNLSPVKIHLHKIVPMGAGLGGGSADAAHALRLLNNVFHLNLSALQLGVYATKLVSDCNFFLDEKPMIGSGRGEVLKPIQISLKSYTLIIVKPPIHVSTADAYQGVTLTPEGESIETILQHPIENWKDKLVNHFEKSVFEKFPAIQFIKEKCYSRGAIYASMSGSGSSVFAIFKKSPQLQSEFVGSTYWESVI